MLQLSGEKFKISQKKTIYGGRRKRWKCQTVVRNAVAAEQPFLRDKEQLSREVCQGAMEPGNAEVDGDTACVSLGRTPDCPSPPSKPGIVLHHFCLVWWVFLNVIWGIFWFGVLCVCFCSCVRMDLGFGLFVFYFF